MTGVVPRRRRGKAGARTLPRVRAAVIEDGQVGVAERPDPEPGAGEVLVRVRAAGINGADLLQRKGAYPAPPGAPPDIPGPRARRRGRRLGPGAARFAPGDRVMAVVGGGGQAELAVVHERQLMPVPDGSTGRRPAAPEVFTTAHDALFTQAGLGPGERLLVHGAAGGVGTRRPARRRRRRATSPPPSAIPAPATACAELGADEVLDPEGFADHGPVRRRARARRRAQPAGRTWRRWPWTAGSSSSASARGFKAELNLLALMGKRARITGSTLRPRPLEEKAITARAMERQVLPLLAAGACACRSRRPSRWTRCRRPTSASRPAASSARSCSWRL